MVDENDGLAIGLVTTNNPYLTDAEVDDGYRVCDPVENHPMLASVTEPDNVEKGVTYACEYDDLRDAFVEVPDLGSLGLLI